MKDGQTEAEHSEVEIRQDDATRRGPATPRHFRLLLLRTSP